MDKDIIANKYPMLTDEIMETLLAVQIELEEKRDSKLKYAIHCLDHLNELLVELFTA